MLNIFNRPEMRLEIPRTLNRETMYPFIETVIDCDKLQPKCSKLIFGFGHLEFIEPVGVVVLCSMIQWLRKRGVKISFVNHTKLTPAARYLDDSKFFERYLDHKLDSFSDVRATTIPLSLVQHARSFSYIEALIYWLSKRLEISPAALSGIKVCMQEIFNNIRDHSEQDVGCIFVQHYPRKDQIQLAISDFGVGIPANVRTVSPNLGDAEAILSATVEGFTSKPGGRNRGAGLDILIQQVAGTNKGSVHIHSSKGIVTAFSDYTTVQRRARSSKVGTYPGTLIQMNLRTDTIDRGDEYEEEFEWS